MIEYGGKIYKTVVINEQEWFAENLDFSFPHMPIGCYYEHKEENAKYGRLYTWDEAMRIAPEGWRLPSKKDWDELIKVCGGKNRAYRLKSKTGWGDYPFKGKNGFNSNGSDQFGFNVLPGGNYTKQFVSEGTNGLYWTSTTWINRRLNKLDGSHVYGVFIRGDCHSIETDRICNKTDMLSVRFIKNI